MRLRGVPIHTLRWLRDGGWAWLTFRPGSRPRRIARRRLLGLAIWVRSEPRRHALAVRFLRQAPWLDRRLRSSFQRPTVETDDQRRSADDRGMSAEAQRIYARIYETGNLPNRGKEGR